MKKFIINSWNSREHFVIEQLEECRSPKINVVIGQQVVEETADQIQPEDECVTLGQEAGLVRNDRVLKNIFVRSKMISFSL